MLLYQLLHRLKFYFFPKEHIEKANAKNPYDNESILNQLLADMKNLEEKINQKVQFESMWREMNQIVEKAEKKTISIARCYPMKNRVPDVLPFDNSRFDIFIYCFSVKSISRKISWNWFHGKSYYNFFNCLKWWHIFRIQISPFHQA